MKLSSPRLSSFASDLMFSDLLFQLMRHETRCSRLSGMSRAPVEDLERILLVVLAAQAEQHPVAHLPDHEFLQRTVRRGHFDTQGAVLAAHPFPERVVAVQRDHLERFASAG